MLTAILIGSAFLIATPLQIQCMADRATFGSEFCALAPAGDSVRASVCEQNKPIRSYRWTAHGWITDATAELPAPGRDTARTKAHKRCAALVPPPTISMKEAVRLRPHLRFGPGLELGIGGCVETEDAVFFGIDFYEGEGIDGVGGIGRFDRKTKKTVVRRPPFLLDKSIDEMVLANGRLWMTIFQHYEGDSVSHGVASYDWNTDRLELLEGRDQGPCGFGVTDLTLAGGRLWVRTELDLASMDLSTGVWDHVVPSPAGPVAASCRWIDARIVAASHEKTPTCFSEHSGASALDHIAAFRPASLVALISQFPAPTWNQWEAMALARTATSFAELDECVLRPLGLSRTPPSLSRRSAAAWNAMTNEQRRRVDLLNEIVSAYGERNSTEPAWRDYLLRIGADHELRWFRGDDLVACALLSRLASETFLPDVLVDVAGSRAVAPLMVALVTKGDSGFDLRRAEIIGALERATHQMFAADGTVYRLAPDSDTPGYDEDTPMEDQPHSAASGWGRRYDAEREQIIQRWAAWWEAHKNEPQWRAPNCRSGSPPDQRATSTTTGR